MKKQTGVKQTEFKNIALVYRIHTREAIQSAEELTRWLRLKKHRVFTAPKQKLLKGTEPLNHSKELDKINLVVVFGGDGTYLRAVRLFQEKSVPILGFNMGSLGFLTLHSSVQMKELVAQSLAGKMMLHSRSMLNVEIKRQGKSRGTFAGLNDVVIERGSQSQLINVAVYSEKLLVSEVKADGVIISSPTGSTAYNLAAGGPILDPEVKAIVVTPVAPHALTIRPLIFPDHRNLSFRLAGKPHEGYLIVDGQRQIEVTNDDEIFISKNKIDHWLVRTPSHNFYHLLREKLKFGDRS